jgi:hypothetical protein
MGKNMMKKMLFTLVAAAALSVPLAEVAMADTSTSNQGGVPGNNNGTPPGSGVSDLAQKKGPGTSLAEIFRVRAVHSPGDAINNAAPGQMR